MNASTIIMESTEVCNKHNGTFKIIRQGKLIDTTLITTNCSQSWTKKYFDLSS